MATRYARADGDIWGTASSWNTAANGSGSAGVPVTGDTCDLNGHVVTWSGTELTAAPPAIIQDTAGGGTLSPASTGTYTIGTVANPTIIKSSATASAGVLIVADEQNVILYGGILNSSTTVGNQSFTVLLTPSGNGHSCSLTINTSTGNAIENRQPASSIGEACGGILASGAGDTNVAFNATLTVNGNTLNTGIDSAAILSQGALVIVNGNATNGQNGTGTIAAGGAAIAIECLSPGLISSCIVTGNVTNYANSGYPLICPFTDSAKGVGNQIDIHGNWQNYDPSVSAHAGGVGSPTPIEESLFIIRGNVDSVAGTRCMSIAITTLHCGILVVLGKFLQEVYWTGVVVMSYANAFTAAVQNDNGVWICIGTPNVDAIKGTNDHWRYVISVPAITIQNPAALFSDTPYLSGFPSIGPFLESNQFLGPFEITPTHVGPFGIE